MLDLVLGQTSSDFYILVLVYFMISHGWGAINAVLDTLTQIPQNDVETDEYNR